MPRADYSNPSNRITAGAGFKVKVCANCRFTFELSDMDEDTDFCSDDCYAEWKLMQDDRDDPAEDR